MKIPSAFGKEKPQKGVSFEELPRVRELDKKYSCRSDTEILESFQNSPATDSVLRFFLYMQAKRRGIENLLRSRIQKTEIHLVNDEIILFIFVEEFIRDSSLLVSVFLLFFAFFLWKYLS